MDDGKDLPCFYRTGSNHWGINKDDDGYFIVLGTADYYISGLARYETIAEVEAIMLKDELIEADLAIASGNVVQMIAAFKDLQTIKE